MSTQIAEPEKKTFVITRHFDAPRDLVWKVLTEAEHMQKWSGPKEATVIVSKMDFRPGGSYHYGMRMESGHEMWGKAVYREIDEPGRIVYINSFSDKDGGLTRHPMSATWPLELLTTYTLEDEGGGTKLTITWVPINESDVERETFNNAFDGCTQGWNGSLDKLRDHLATVKNS